MFGNCVVFTDAGLEHIQVDDDGKIEVMVTRAIT